MSETTDIDPLATPFLQSLVARIRAEDAFGAWDRKTDLDLLEDYIVTKEQRRAIPIIVDPDPDTLDRVEKFYQAVGLAIERVTGVIASPMTKLSHEGFGRVVLISGRLVVHVRSLRDVHRFGFNDLGALAKEGMKAVAEAVEMIEAHPDLARA